jgi:hypothetical protein
VYSFSMIAYQLFELMPPFSGMDPVDAARKAALAEERPPLLRLATQMPTYKVRDPLLIVRQCLCCERSPFPACSDGPFRRRQELRCFSCVAGY